MKTLRTFEIYKTQFEVFLNVVKISFCKIYLKPVSSLTGIWRAYNIFGETRHFVI